MLNKNLKLKIINFNTSVVPTWCPGCGNYLILANIINALKQHNYQKHNTVIVYDIGCAGKMADFIDTYGIHSLHGRCIPTAVGIKFDKFLMISSGKKGRPSYLLINLSELTPIVFSKKFK